MREELSALRECLVGTGVLREQHFLACLHRRRFAAVRRAHPPGGGASPAWNDATSVEGIATRIGAYLRRREAHRLLLPVSQSTRSVLGATLLRCQEHLYVCGGFNSRRALSSVERLGLEQDRWETLPPMCERHDEASSVVINGRLYVCGCFDGHQAGRSVECFDPEMQRWESMPPMAEARGGAFGVALGGHLYICGGYDGHRALCSVERLDP